MANTLKPIVAHVIPSNVKVVGIAILIPPLIACLVMEVFMAEASLPLLISVRTVIMPLGGDK